MSATYPKHATPLPWPEERYAGMCGSFSIADTAYALRAANAFPHLVAALGVLLDEDDETGRTRARRALAIARGETTP